MNNRILYIKRLCLLLCLAIVNMIVCAQNSAITLPYTCSFEASESGEISNWVLNAGADGPNCNDQWMIGELEHNDGKQSLYISCDSGLTSTYGSKKNLVVAYRVFEFSERVTADITFDYKLYGEENTSMLYVGLVQERLDIPSNATNPALSVQLKNQLTHRFSQSINWQTYTIQNQSFAPNVRVKLIFVWENYNTDTTKNNPMSPCIDNIQITKSNCKMPSNLQMESECGSFTATWDGTSDSYEFQYRKTGNQNWTTIKTTDKFMKVEDIEEGQWDMRVRGICNSDEGEMQSAYIALNAAVCFCADNHCINYVDLYSEGVICQTGTVAGGFSTASNQISTVVDFGPNNANSRHTVYWDRGQYDPRTGGKLKTIPDGELASVRLGNWLKGAEAERITYEYYVDPNTDVILLMKYAIVLEKPAPTHQAPAFEFKILDQNGNAISSCVEANFTPHDEYIEWNNYTPDFRSGFDEIVWKDWSSIGVDLRNYKGQTIKVQLTTQDCELTAHCGYAYFTLGCIDAGIKSTSCGDDINISLVAPDGFRYTWYHLDDDNKEVFDTNEKELQVPSNDTATYYCRIDYLDQLGCDFTLHTEVRPRVPFANFEYEWIPSDCKNQVKFTTKSEVLTRIDGQEVSNGEKVENHYWSINGEVVSELTTFVYDVDSMGETLNLNLSVGISDNQCMDDSVYQIVIPAIYSETVRIDTVLCDGDYLQTNFGAFFSDTVAVHTEKSKWCGCDSTTIVNLKIIRQEDVYVYDTVCSAEPYIYNGQELKESGEYEFRLYSSLGCDSVVILNLEMLQALEVGVEDVYRYVCADDSVLTIEYTHGERVPMEYSIIFDDFEKDNGFVDIENQQLNTSKKSLNIKIPKNCRPNSYKATIVFIDKESECSDIVVPIEFDVYYSISIMQAKFGNLITVFNSDNNGGYVFDETAYRWYKNGVLLENETKEYLYLPEGEKFNSEDCYYIELKRVDDGVTMPTCEICPDLNTSIEDLYFKNELSLTTSIALGENIQVFGVEKGNVNIYTIAGQLVSTHTISIENNSLASPIESGIYLLQIVTERESVVYKIRVK